MNKSTIWMPTSVSMKQLALSLVDNCIPFYAEPLPDDIWEVVVKTESLVKAITLADLHGGCIEKPY